VTPHTVPHVPQLLVSDVRLKHWLAASQCVVPATEHRHVPFEHTSPPRHRMPHPPQLALSVVVACSHPLAGFRSQSAKPARHSITTHVPPVHAAVAFARLQAPPQRPQCAVLVLVLVSHPLLALLSQLPRPGLHMIPHAPFVHVAVPPVELHGRPHPPQCIGLVLVLVSHDWLPSQSAVGIAQSPAIPQPPLTHTDMRPAGGVQRIPHRPQWATVVLMLASQPLAGSPSQSSKPTLHVPTRHCPITHALVALSSMQRRPQVMQLFTSVWRLASQPVVIMLSQLAKPALHAKRHWPITHVLVALIELHTRPHAPQFIGSVIVSAQRPLHAVWPGHTSWHDDTLASPARMQAVPASHIAPHAPQLAFCVGSTQSLLHTMRPAGHVMHTPLLQFAPTAHPLPCGPASGTTPPSIPLIVGQQR
jgi:hypothetical protein